MKNLQQKKTTYVEYENKSDASNNKENWNYLTPFRKYLEYIPGGYGINELQKTLRPRFGMH
jgi:hypothetical protein